MDKSLDFDYWFVPKDHPELDLAWKFLAYASRPDRQGDQTNYIAYGPMVKGADKFVNPDILPHLPTAPQNTQNYFLMDQRRSGRINRETHFGPHGDLDGKVTAPRRAIVGDDTFIPARGTRRGPDIPNRVALRSS